MCSTAARSTIMERSAAPPTHMGTSGATSMNRCSELPEERNRRRRRGAVQGEARTRRARALDGAEASPCKSSGECCAWIGAQDILEDVERRAAQRVHEQHRPTRAAMRTRDRGSSKPDRASDPTSDALEERNAAPPRGPLLFPFEDRGKWIRAGGSAAANIEKESCRWAQGRAEALRDLFCEQ